jgi:hypothetical protein
VKNSEKSVKFSEKSVKKSENFVLKVKFFEKYEIFQKYKKQFANQN